MIEVHDLVKKFGSNKAVDGLSFSVERGELFGLLGPNGAGKTTTISMLATLLPIDGGKASIGGHDVVDGSAAVRNLIGIVPQEIALYNDLNSRDNLQFWGSLYGMGGTILESRIEELLELAELTEYASQKVETFSGGMKRRLNLISGLVHSPEVLFLDEPTVGIDAQARSRILEMIGNLSVSGLTVIYTTHYLEEAEQLCDRIGVVDKGRMVALGNKEDLINQIGDNDYISFMVPADRLESVMAQAHSWDGVLDVEFTRGKIKIKTSDGSQTLPYLQSCLVSEKLSLEQLEISRPNLETLYLNLTGRSLREQVKK